MIALRPVFNFCRSISVLKQLPKSTVALNTVRSAHLNAGLDSERRYTRKHEWVQVKDDIGTVGISNFAQDALGEIVYVQLPDSGSDVKQAEECGALESVKAASEVYSPVSGKVTLVNYALIETPALINWSCYKDGWLFKVKLSNPEECQKLMDEKAYAEYLRTQAHSE